MKQISGMVPTVTTNVHEARFYISYLAH